MKISTLLAVTAFALSTPLFAQEKSAAPAAAKSEVKVIDVTPDEAEKQIAAGVTVIDLRTEEEFENKHIKGAKNMNALDPDFAKGIAALDPKKPILVHCQSGQRSTTAIAGVISKSRIQTVYHLSSGLSGWKKAGKPLEVTPTPVESKVLPERLR